jgi:hypothetical protein
LSEQVEQTESTETTFRDDAVRGDTVRRGAVRVEVVGRSERPEWTERPDAITEHVRIVKLFRNRWSGHRRPNRSGVDLFGIESSLLQSRHLSGLNTVINIITRVINFKDLNPIQIYLMTCDGLMNCWAKESSSSSRAKTTGVSIQNCLLRRQADVALTNWTQTVRVVEVMVENDVDVDVVVLVTVDT